MYIKDPTSGERNCSNGSLAPSSHLSRANKISLSPSVTVLVTGVALLIKFWGSVGGGEVRTCAGPFEENRGARSLVFVFVVVVRLRGVAM